MVVDVGAGVGDTAILFSLTGKVIALEPYPRLFNLACINVKVNGFEDRVELLNVALASSDGYAYASEGVLGYTLFRPALQGKLIKTVSLKYLVENYGIVDGVLKMDCEGCEYQVLESVDINTLRVFKQIVIEYHNGAEPITKVLRNAGYNIEMKPMRSTSISIAKQGYIVARL